MNRIDDMTIERYLGGAMTAAEQAEFRAMIAADPSLRRRVASEESMLRKLAADRTTSARDHSALRSRLMASLPPVPAAESVQPPSRTSGLLGRGWPVIGTVLLVASWIVVDAITFERDATELRSSSPIAAPASPAPNQLPATDQPTQLRSDAPRIAPSSLDATIPSAQAAPAAESVRSATHPSAQRDRARTADAQSPTSRPTLSRPNASANAAQPNAAAPVEAVTKKPLPKVVDTVARGEVKVEE